MEINPALLHNIHYSLSIRFHSDGFSFYVHDDCDALVATKNISTPLLGTNEDAILKLVSNEIESKLEYKDICIVCETDIYTLIPNQFFSIETASDFLEFEHEKSKNQKVITQALTQWQCTFISSVPLHLYKATLTLFPTAHFQDHVSYFILRKIEPNKNDSLHVLARENRLDLVLIKNVKIEFINSFTFSTPEDFTYYVLNIFEKFELNTETLPTFIYKLGKRTHTKNLLSLYINNLIFSEED